MGMRQAEMKLGGPFMVGARNVELILDSSSYGVYAIRCAVEGIDPMSESAFDMIRGVMSGDVRL